MGFNLDNYRRPQKKEIDEQQEEVPSWVTEANNLKINKLYEVVINEFKRINLAIENNEKLKLGQRQIKNAGVAKIAGVDRSYIRPDRPATKMLIDLIAEKNKYLDSLWIKYNKKITSGKKLTKKQLASRKTQLENQIKNSADINYRDYLNEWLDSNVLEANKRLHEKIKLLEEDNSKLDEQLTKCRSDLTKGRMKLIK